MAAINSRHPLPFRLLPHDTTTFAPSSSSSSSHHHLRSHPFTTTTTPPQPHVTTATIRPQPGCVGSIVCTSEGKVDSSKALDAGLVITKSNVIESERHVSSSRSRNDTHVEDVDINSVNDKELMAEVQLTAQHNVLANV
ncbi:hypothetical protein Tco_0215125 [Tanacetum coccineum]